MSFPHQSINKTVVKKGNWAEQIFFVEALENFQPPVTAGAFVCQILSSA